MPIDAINIFYYRERTEYEKKLDVLKTIIKNAPTADLMNQLCVLSIKAEEAANKYNNSLATAHSDYLNTLERDWTAINEMIRRIKEEIIRRCGQ